MTATARNQATNETTTGRQTMSEAAKHTAHTCEDCMGDALALVAQIEAQERLMETLTEALSKIEGMDSYIDATPRGGRKVVAGPFASIARAALSRAEGKAS